VSDPASFNFALEVVKCYVRAKIKKGRGKEVSGPGGKVSAFCCKGRVVLTRFQLEALEVKVGHLFLSEST
jgi:hypothetical protein